MDSGFEGWADTRLLEHLPGLLAKRVILAVALTAWDLRYPAPAAVRRLGVQGLQTLVDLTLRISGRYEGALRALGLVMH